VTLLVLGIGAVLLALAIIAAVVLLPRTTQMPRLPRLQSVGGLRRQAVDAADRVLRARGWRAGLEERLDLAGMTASPAGVAVTVALIAAGAVLAGVGIALVRPSAFAWMLPVVLAAFVVLGARLVIERRISRRQAAFAEQLDDTLSLVASGLRAGHSLPRALDAVSHEAESPTAEEFSRALNEHRLGRDLNEALELVAERMRSDDLAWVAQAVAIHREVGGNLSEVLDHVGETIRERNQIRRQVRTLSAEGRISANVLIALPILIAVVLSVLSPAYISTFVTTPLGLALVGVSALLFIVGVVWLRSVVKVSF
jgi:tight adherence protein B